MLFYTEGVLHEDKSVPPLYYSYDPASQNFLLLVSTTTQQLCALFISN